MRVLIVDDVRTARAVVRGVLEANGYEVAGEAASGRDALSQLLTASPDLVLLDIELPDMSGIQVAHRILESMPTPVIVLSGHDDEALLERATDAGVHAYLTKPFRADELLRAMSIARARFEDSLHLKRLQRAAERRALQLTLAHEIIQQIAGSDLTDPGRCYTFMHTVASSIRHAFGHKIVSVLLREEDDLLVVAAAGTEANEEWLGRRYPINNSGILRWVANNGAPILAPDVSKEPRFSPGQSLPDTRGELTVPLKVHDRVLGVLDIQADQPGQLDHEDLELVEILSSHLASVLENMRLVSELRERGMELAETNRQLLEAQEQLVKTERLAAIGQTVAAVQHEINNPLTAVLGNAQWLIRRGDDLPHGMLDILRVIERESIRIRDVVGRLGKAEDRLVPYVGNIQMIDLMGQQGHKVSSLTDSQEHVE